MTLASQLSKVPVLQKLNSHQILGYIVEFAPSDQLIDLNSYSTDPKLKSLLKTSLDQIENHLSKIDDHTLVILKTNPATLQANAKFLEDLNCFECGIIVDRFFPLEDQSYILPTINGFYHFPIDEIAFGSHWTLDEIFRYLSMHENLNGPSCYSVFDPIWKYSFTKKMRTEESDFHTKLKKHLFLDASKMTYKELSFRNYEFKTAPKLKIFHKFIFLVLGRLANIFENKLRVFESREWRDSLWQKWLYPALESFWLKPIYWPIEYQIRNRRNTLSADQYREMKGREIQKKESFFSRIFSKKN